MNYAVIGSPVGHSLSPAMFNAVFKRMGLAHEYSAIRVSPEELGDFMDCVKKENIWGGFSVTIPHKENIVPILDSISDEARGIGAVNTVVVKDGKLAGYNTDWIGVKRAIEEVTDIAGKKVTIVGAGGAGAASLYAVLRSGGHPTVLNRTAEKAKRLVDRLMDGCGVKFGTKCAYGSLSDLENVETDILIQTTPIGMTPNEDDTIVPEDFLSSDMTVMDVVYNPHKTRLLLDAENAGCKLVFGYKMLLFQGVEQFKIWFGEDPDMKVMEGALLGKLL